MTVQELIEALQALPDELRDASVFAEYREFRGELDVEGEPCEVDFCSMRVDTVGRGKRKRSYIILY